MTTILNILLFVSFMGVGLIIFLFTAWVGLTIVDDLDRPEDSRRPLFLTRTCFFIFVSVWLVEIIMSQQFG